MFKNVLHLFTLCYYNTRNKFKFQEQILFKDAKIMDYKLLIEVSSLYYEENLSQAEIAKQLKLSRVKVSRLLKEAREENIVKISIDRSYLYNDLEQSLKNIYGLKSVKIIGGRSDNIFYKATSKFILENIEQNITIGWGKTLRNIINQIDTHQLSDLLITPMIGGQSYDQADLHASNIANDLARKLKARSLSLNAPAIADTLEEANIYKNNSMVRRVIQASETSEMAIFSLGNPMLKESSIHRMNYFPENDITLLEDEHVVCDIASLVFFDKKGSEKGIKISNRSVGLTRQQLEDIPNKLCVVKEIEKIDALVAALNAKIINTLIISSELASALVKSTHNNEN